MIFRVCTCSAPNELEKFLLLPKNSLLQADLFLRSFFRASPKHFSNSSGDPVFICNHL